jgi:hypothetical protein
MTIDINDLFDEVVAGPQPAPGKPMTGADLYAAGRTRRRRLLAARIGGAAVAGTLLVTGATLLSLDRDPGRAPDSADTVATWDGVVLSVAAGDRDHLYAIVNSCPTADPSTCTQNLLGSDDGGRRWRVRSRDIRAQQVFAAGPDVVRLDNAYPRSASGPPSPLASADRISVPVQPGTVSVDGGRTWKDILTRGEPVDAAVAGGWMQPGCSGRSNVDLRCGIFVVEPHGGWAAWLANQPPLDGVPSTLTEPAPGSAWYSGYDRQAGSPVLSITTDAGRTWITRRFTDNPGSANSAFNMRTASLDGITGYAVVVGGDKGILVYRTTDAGVTWQQVDQQRTAPWSYGGGSSYIATDGTHVIAKHPSETISTISFSASRDNGGHYQPITLDGLPAEIDPAEAMPVRTIPGGGYYARTRFDLYLSDDGLSWRRVQIPTG